MPTPFYLLTTAIPAALLLCSCGSSEASGPAATPTKYATLSADIDPVTAKTMADVNLKALLKDPDSAKFRNVFISRISGGNLMLCGEVNSKNSLGGYTGYKRFIASPNPQAPSIIDGETAGISRSTFAGAYKEACAFMIDRFS